MDGFRVVTCQSCNFVGEPFESDGFFFCSSCGEKNQDAFDNGAEEEEAFGTAGGINLPSHQRRASAHSEAIDVPPISQYDPLSQSNLLSSLGLIEVKQENVDLSHSHFSPSTPADFGGSNVPSSEDYHNEIRLRYVFGLQIMIELQCEALVKEFKVTPLICGLVGPIWLRFVAKTGVFDEDWANKVLHDSEMQKEGDPEDYNSRGPLFSEDDAGTIKEREVFINKKFATEKSNVISEKKPLPADIQSAFVVQIKSVFKCRLCPRIICLTEDTLRNHLQSKRHARSEKLHMEGRLKVMLNSNGEIENQEDSDKETEDTEVGSSTV
ncbi:hypothetical protein RYX36_007057 [Vicia faba]